LRDRPARYVDQVRASSLPLDHGSVNEYMLDFENTPSSPSHAPITSFLCHIILFVFCLLSGHIGANIFHTMALGVSSSICCLELLEIFKAPITFCPFLDPCIQSKHFSFLFLLFSRHSGESKLFSRYKQKCHDKFNLT